MRILALLLTAVLFMSLVAPAFAAGIGGLDEVAIAMEADLPSDIRAIALNAPAQFEPTADWVAIKITKETPLYDLYGELLAYCVDLQNIDTGANAYIIITADETDFPILQYAPSAVSPYYEEIVGNALYLGVGLYYTDDGETITEIYTEEATSKAELMKAISIEAASLESRTNALQFEGITSSDFSEVREAYISGEFSASAVKARILSGVPNWQWKKGCAPTAVGMQIAKQYPSLANYSIVDSLAEYMGTKTDGSTEFLKITSGSKAVIALNKIAAPSYCGWANANASGVPNTGSSYNSQATYTAEIDAGRAVGIYTSGGTATSPAYSSGFGAHMLTGVGYSYDTSASYVIVHTTAVSDGQVYVSFSGLGAYAWFIVRP